MVVRGVITPRTFNLTGNTISLCRALTNFRDHLVNLIAHLFAADTNTATQYRLLGNDGLATGGLYGRYANYHRFLRRQATTDDLLQGEGNSTGCYHWIPA